MTSLSTVELFVNGTLMRGLQLHDNLAGATFLGERTTVPAYRLHAIDASYPAMVRDDENGTAIAGELYAMELSQLARVLEREPAGLGIGVIELDDAAGHRIGVVWTGGELPETATDITQLGGWRAYLAERSSAAAAGEETRG